MCRNSIHLDQTSLNNLINQSSSNGFKHFDKKNNIQASPNSNNVK
jgi:hypothetical protein